MSITYIECVFLSTYDKLLYTVVFHRLIVAGSLNMALCQLYTAESYITVVHCCIICSHVGLHCELCKLILYRVVQTHSVEGGSNSSCTGWCMHSCCDLCIVKICFTSIQL